jgi:hypothetical protein
VYKIRDPQTGLFSSGGQNARWTEVGKVWTRLGDLKSHLRLTQYGERYGRYWVPGVKNGKGWPPIDYKGCEIVAFRATWSEGDRIPIQSEWIG